MTCPHMPTQNLFSNALKSISYNLLEGKITTIYGKSYRLREQNQELNREGYTQMIFEAYTSTGFVPDIKQIPENHAGYELFIKEKFPDLYSRLQLGRKEDKEY